MGGLNTQSKSMRDIGPFEEAADRALATTGAAGARKPGRPGDSFLLPPLPGLIQSIAHALKSMEQSSCKGANSVQRLYIFEVNEVY